jgi:dienelactone hydrolase
MDRRAFLRSGTAVAAAAGAVSTLAGPSLAKAQTAPFIAPKPVLNPEEPVTRRWVEQRWITDNIIRANGIDWDQPRSAYLNAPCGFEALGDFTAVRQRVQKFDDIAPAFEGLARRREAMARAALDQAHAVWARENFYIAATLWGSAQWPINAATEQNLFYNQRKRECYAAYAKLADHRVEEVWVPFQGTALPAWLHLPIGYQGGRLPAVWSIQGMDGFKEGAVSLYGDRLLARGVAVLAVDGPGSYESPLLGIHTSVSAWEEAGRAIYAWMAARPEIDPRRIAILGSSFGTFYGTVAAAAEPRHAAMAGFATCLEPGCDTMFNQASPTFKRRFMFMSGILDEAKFDQFMKTLTLDGVADRLAMPYLMVGGDSDELSPLKYTDRQFQMMKAPRQLVIYQESRHSVGGVPSTVLGPSPNALLTDWLIDRFASKPFKSERWFVDSSGKVNKTPLA